MKRVLLLGAGHAHAVVLRGLARHPLHGARITLISPELKPIYSGMLPGVVAGHYRRAEAEIDFGALAERASAEVIDKAVVRLDPAARRAFLDDGSEHAYDLASLNVGSRIDNAAIPGAREHAIAARPFSPFLEKIRGQERIAIVGAGHGGAELAMAFRRRGCVVTLYSDHPRLERPIVAALRRTRVDYRPAMPAEEIEPGPVVRIASSRQAFDIVVLATGPRPLPWLQSTGLALDDAGYVLADKTLRSPSHPHIFASGDCASVCGAAEPKSGVYSVRHGATLHRNLSAAVRGEPLEAYRANPRALAIVTCGGRRAVALRGNLSVEGRWVWYLKNAIDRRWMQSFKA